MATEQIYQDIARRTGGDIYIGVVGPVRTGKSTFIKKFVELVLLPRMESDGMKSRTRDELPQSAAGRTIMTTEPKFVPERAITVELDGGGSFRTRLIDCVGYMIAGAIGHREDSKPRMVKSPWFDHEIPFDMAAETGTARVIKEHSTVGVVMTTDGSISDIPREGYEAAEARVVRELQEIGKPFLILLNCLHPDTAQAKQLSQELTQRYHHPVLPFNCLEMDENNLNQLLQCLLYEFPVRKIDVQMPRWVTMLDSGHWLQQDLYGTLLEYSRGIETMKDALSKEPPDCQWVEAIKCAGMELGNGTVRLKVTLKDSLFYQILSETTGLNIRDEGGLMPCILELTKAKKEYDKVKNALEQVEATGYGVVMPTLEELKLEQPELVSQGGRYGIKLAATAPSIQMIKANITTEIDPIVGTQQQGEQLIAGLLNDYDQEPVRIWESNIFGKSLYELVNEGLQNKLLHMPPEARERLQETLEKVINEGCSGLICILV